jgi:hypothetical protein
VGLLGAGVGWAEEPWSVYLHDNQHTGRASFSLDPMTLGATPAWSAPPGFSVPIVVGERVYAMASQAGHGDDVTLIAAFDLQTGEQIWATNDYMVFPSAPAYHDGRLVYVGIDWSTSAHLLVVRDAETGALLYSMEIPQAVGVSSPTLYENPQTGEVVAFISNSHYTDLGIGPNMTAVTLGLTSGSIKWADPEPRDFDFWSIPTIVEDSLVVAGPCHYYAYDLETGAVNQLHAGGCYGGGGTTVTYDAQRRQVYILDSYDVDNGAQYDALTAWTYNSKDDIQLAWTKRESDYWPSDGLALDDEGYLWTTTYDRLLKIDPDTGETVASVDGQFASGMRPVVSGDYVWTYTPTWRLLTVVYDRRTLVEAATFPGTQGDTNSPFSAPGALAESAFLRENGRFYMNWGFDVFLPVPDTCGDPFDTGSGVNATDALVVLKASVGLAECDPCLCDVDGSSLVVATDALAILHAAVGLPARLRCPACTSQQVPRGRKAPAS